MTSRWTHKWRGRCRPTAVAGIRSSCQGSLEVRPAAAAVIMMAVVTVPADLHWHTVLHNHGCLVPVAGGVRVRRHWQSGCSSLRRASWRCEAHHAALARRRIHGPTPRTWPNCRLRRSCSGRRSELSCNRTSTSKSPGATAAAGSARAGATHTVTAAAVPVAIARVCIGSTSFHLLQVAFQQPTNVLA